MSATAAYTRVIYVMDDCDFSAWPTLKLAYAGLENPGDLCRVMKALGAPDAELRAVATRLIRQTPLPEGGVVADLLESDDRAALEAAEKFTTGHATAQQMAAARYRAYSLTGPYRARNAGMAVHAACAVPVEAEIAALYAASAAADHGGWTARQAVHAAQLAIIRNAFPWERVARLAARWEKDND